MSGNQPAGPVVQAGPVVVRQQVWVQRYGRPGAPQLKTLWYGRMTCRELGCDWRTEFIYVYATEASVNPCTSLRVDWLGRFLIDLDTEEYRGSPNQPLILGPSEHFRAWTFFEWDAVPPPLRYASVILAVGLSAVVVLAAICAVADTWPGPMKQITGSNVTSDLIKDIAQEVSSKRIREYEELMATGIRKMNIGHQDLKDIEDEAEGEGGASGGKASSSTPKDKDKDKGGGKASSSTPKDKDKDKGGGKASSSTPKDKDKDKGEKHTSKPGG